MGGDDSQKLLPWRGSYSSPGRKPPAPLRNQHSNPNPPPDPPRRLAGERRRLCLGEYVRGSATGRLGHSWKAQAGHSWRAAKLTSANKPKTGYSCCLMLPIRLSQICSFAISCEPSRQASAASCNAIWWASSCRTWTGTGCKPSRSIFRRAKDSFERITVRWRGRLVVMSSPLASLG